MKIKYHKLEDYFPELKGDKPLSKRQLIRLAHRVSGYLTKEAKAKNALL